MIATTAAMVYTCGSYGEPNTWTGPRLRYTGQIALPEVSLYHYKARVYDPNLGRFLQTDPIGYQDDQNLYAYVYNDPLNRVDPSGTTGEKASQGCGTRISGANSASCIGGGNPTSRSAPAPIEGRPQTTGTPGHAETMQARAAADSMRPDANRVHMNQTLSTITRGEVKSRLKPDNAVVRSDGKIDIHETLSKSQFGKASAVEAKYRDALPESLRGSVTSAPPKVIRGVGWVGGVLGIVHGVSSAAEHPDAAFMQNLWRVSGFYDLGVEAGLVAPPPPEY